MDAKTNIKSRLPSRHVTEGSECAPAFGGSADASHHLPAIASHSPIKFDLFDVAEIFKKTPCFVDLKPAGRDIAKDMFDVGGVPRLMKNFSLDHGLNGDCRTAAGRTIAENLISLQGERAGGGREKHRYADI
jgi:dihydroxy-acid dehydratase